MFSFMQSLHSFDQRFEIRLIKQTCWWLDRSGRGSRAGEIGGARGALALKDLASSTRPSISFCPLRFSDLPPGLGSRWLWGHSNCFWGSRADETEGVRGARAYKNFGRIRSKPFFLKCSFIFLCPTRFSNLLRALGNGSRAGRTEGVRAARAPQDFGSIRSKTFSLKFPFIFLCPTRFSDLLSAFGSRFWGHPCRFWVGAMRFISFRSQLDF